jgi:acyl-CoA reductase-like NAD-dependent aldehyde dehydrogenase
MTLRAGVTALPPYEPFLLGGVWTERGDRDVLDIFDPATEELLTTVAQATDADVEAAVSSAVGGGSASPRSSAPASCTASPT